MLAELFHLLNGFTFVYLWQSVTVIWRWCFS